MAALSPPSPEIEIGLRTKQSIEAFIGAMVVENAELQVMVNVLRGENAQLREALAAMQEPPKTVD